MPYENGSNVEESNSNVEKADFDMEDADFNVEEADFDMEEAGFNMEEAEVQGSSRTRSKCLRSWIFHAIQSLQQQVATPKTIDDLIIAGENSFEEFSPMDSDKNFLTLQTCMREIMKVKGCNKYKILHIKKDQLAREGRLPTRIACDPALVQEARDFLPPKEGVDQIVVPTEEVMDHTNVVPT
ncbi:hypothetical protein CCACVL1_05377 [Corchorus capsularis]|uniref:Uncharacterized protein n=1 Tax=Corchorus capsularis TaxID=210143 RepID=A0A1R3JL40_COCAP|nr:hypothetical protein CCACVL1_05377 [Corchorus capsularis]